MKLFQKVVARGLKATDGDPERSIARILVGNPQASHVYHVAKEFLVGQWRLSVLQDLDLFECNNEELGPSEAVACYAMLSGRKGIPVSKSTVYEFRKRFALSGLAGLMPERNGGRPARIPIVDLSIIRRLLRETPTPRYAFYLWGRHLGNLPGQPITRMMFQQIVRNLTSTKSPSRRRHVRSTPPKPTTKVTSVETVLLKRA